MKKALSIIAVALFIAGLTGCCCPSKGCSEGCSKGCCEKPAELVVECVQIKPADLAGFIYSNEL